VPPAYQKFRETRFFGSLDGLRALSILMVVWTHAWDGLPQAKWLDTVPILSKGVFGVDIFFVISGFLITTLLLREREKSGTISLRDFYIRRTLRIWPLYYSVLALYVVLMLGLERGTEKSRIFFSYVPAYLTYTYNVLRPANNEVTFNFAWSLCAEEQFYLIWPLVLKLLRGPWPIFLMIGMVLLKAAGEFSPLVYWLPADALAGRMVLSIAVPICMGALLAQILDRPWGFASLYKVLGHKGSAPIALGLVALSLASNSPYLLAFTWLTMPALIGAAVVREDNGLSGILRLRPIAFVGVISYGMYLFNALAVNAVRAALAHVGITHPLAAFPVVLGVTILVAFLSYRWFESPFLKLKARFSHLRPPRTARQ